MIEILDSLIPYLKGLWTLPWILIGFLVTIALSKIFGEEKINTLMKKIGLILLYFFVPLLLFRLLLSVNFHESELLFIVACFFIMVFMYVLAYMFAKVKAKSLHLSPTSQRTYLKTMLTNQGRSSAFIGGAMLGISQWSIYALLYMSIGAIFLFALIPYMLAWMHSKEMKQSEEIEKITALPWYLRLFPWYLISIAIAAVLIHTITGVTHRDFGNIGILFEFITQLTIPAALYYVGAGIHPRDINSNELKKLLSRTTVSKDHWPWVRHICFLTIIITPLFTIGILAVLHITHLIPSAWFSVMVINSILPITSTNMFLIPYGIDKKATALSVTWSTLICVPLVVVLIAFFHQLFI